LLGTIDGPKASVSVSGIESPLATPLRSLGIGCECVFLGLGSRHGRLAESPDGTPDRNLRFVKKASKP
jgi:hypothetical protein